MPAVILVITAADDGPGSLRQAILDANETGDMDQIQIDSSVGSIGLASELPQIITSMDITTLNGASTTITRPPATPFRFFTIPFNGNIVSLSRFNFVGGSASDGGAIWSFANLTVTSCTFNGNSATNNGGAIFQTLAPLTVTACSFTNNTAGSDGGGISFESGGVQPLTVVGCSFTSNTAGRDGGGIFFQGTGTVTITRFSSFFSNSAITGRGGAICCLECDDLLINDPLGILVPFQGNSAGGTGGAIFANAWRSINLNNANVSGNAAGNPATNGLHLIVDPNTSVLIGPSVTDSFLVQFG